jgi:hypothetical protein
MKRFTRFDGQLWHRMKGSSSGCGAVADQRPKASSGATLCPECEALPDYDVPVLIDGFRGFGDAFYMKGPASRLLRSGYQVCVRTPWPQVFADRSEIRLLAPGKTGLRTQDANAARVPVWGAEPMTSRRVILGYNAKKDFQQGSICEAMESMAGVTGETVAEDYRTKVGRGWVRRWMRELPRPLGVIHPPSVRREQKNPARAPLTEHMQEIVDARRDIFWVSVGWLAEGEESLIGDPLKRVGARYDHGELTVEELLALISIADVAVTGPCWMFPAAMSLGAPLFGVFGGYAPPRTILNPLLSEKVACVAPEKFCACLTDEHDCDKRINRDRLVGEFLKFVEAQCGRN